MADKGGTQSDSENSVQEPRGFVAKLRQELDLRHAYIPLLACCFLSGLTDGTIYNAYGTFVSMQTGNTIFVALGTTGFNNKPYGWARSLCSIGFFVFGSFMFARLYLLLGGKRRGTLLLSFVFQAACVFVACAIAERGVVDPSYPKKHPLEVNFKELIMVALLSFQAAGQIVSSRSLQVGEVPTVVVTSMLCDLVSDPALFTLGKNDKRNRRAIAFVLTLVGAICGGWISKASGNITPSLWLVGGIKVVIGGVWLLWKKKEQQKDVA